MTHELFTFLKQMLYQHRMKHIAVASNATWSDKSRSVPSMFLSEQFNSRSSSKISMNSAVHLHIHWDLTPGMSPLNNVYTSQISISLNLAMSSYPYLSPLFHWCSHTLARQHRAHLSPSNSIKILSIGYDWQSFSDILFDGFSWMPKALAWTNVTTTM
jgi:hypothetical protein